MAIFDDMLKGGIGTGLAVGIGAVVLAPVMGRVLRPVVKTAVKTGLSVYRETAAGLGEATGDLVAEARAELDQENLGSESGRSGARRRSQAGQSEQRSEGHTSEPQSLMRTVYGDI